MSLNQLVSASPPGAGRIYDMWLDYPLAATFPVDRVFTNGISPYQECRNATGDSKNYGAANAAFVMTNGGAHHGGVYRDRVCGRMPNTNGGAPQWNAVVVPTLLGFQAFPNQITSDAALVWRYTATMAAGPCAASATPFDSGFWFASYPGGQNSQGGPGAHASGFGMYWDANGVPTWYSHRTLANQAPDEVVAIGAADQDWHNIEFQISVATKQSDATVAMLFDGVSVIKRGWGAGTLLPDYTSDPNLLQLTCYAGNGSTAFPTFLYVSEFRVIGGPSLAACF